jgi:hypothetical protein
MVEDMMEGNKRTWECDVREGKLEKEAQGWLYRCLGADGDRALWRQLDQRA